jgi:HEAT repeat protein
VDVGDRKDALERALLDLASSLKAVQLYPPTSPVVEAAIKRSLALLIPLSEGKPLIIDVAPDFIRVGEDEVGMGTPLLEQLASRLHNQGIARLHVDPSVNAGSFRRFCELVAGDRKNLDDRGGLERVLSEEGVKGLRVDVLQIERIFDADSSDEPEDLWESLLEGYQESEGIGEIDWGELSANVDKLKQFVEWLLSAAGTMGVLAGRSQTDILRFVCEKVGMIAESLGGDHVNFLVLAVSDLFDKIEPEALIDLLATPMPIAAAVAPPVMKDGKQAEVADGEASVAGGADDIATGVVAGGAGVGGVAAGEGEGESPDSPHSEEVDVTGRIAQGLSPEQVQTLVLHTLRTNDEATPRLYGLFDRLLKGKDDRDERAVQVKEFLDQEIANFGSGEGWLEEWPRLTDALRGDVPRRFLSSDYEATLAHVSIHAAPARLWPLERINPRMSEFGALEVFERKCRVLLAVLDEEDRDEGYIVAADNLAEVLPRLLSQRQFITAEKVLRTFRDHASQDGGKSDAQRKKAEEIFTQFYDQQTLRALVRDSLSRGEEDSEAVAGLLRLGGKGIISGLLETLAKEESRRVRQRLVQMLAAMGEEVLENVKEHLSDERWYFVRNLVLIIGEVGDSRFIPHLEATLAHEDPRVRSETALALMNMQTEGAVDLLIKATHDSDLEVSLFAIHLLGSPERSRGKQRLEQLLRLSNWRGQNSEVIRTATIALGQIGEPSSLPALQDISRRKPRLFKKRREGVREAAAWAVAKLEGADSGPPPDLPELRGLDAKRTSFFRRQS